MVLKICCDEIYAFGVKSGDTTWDFETTFRPCLPPLALPLNKVYSPLSEVSIETLSIIRKIGNNVDLETQEIMPGSHS